MIDSFTNYAKLGGILNFCNLFINLRLTHFPNDHSSINHKHNVNKRILFRVQVLHDFKSNDSLFSFALNCLFLYMLDDNIAEL